MARKKAGGGLEGKRIRVRDGVTSPEFADVSFGGWTGVVTEVTGKPPSLKLVIEWDGETLGKMPRDYVTRCESQQLFYQMACLNEADVELLG
jgi:hypothetical protein